MRAPYDPRTRNVLRRLLELFGRRGQARASEREPDPHERAEEADDEPEPEIGGDSDAPVVMPIEDAIDLHTFAPRDVPSVVEEYLFEAQARGFREVRVIHGRGKGVQRAIVRRVLAAHPAVEAFSDAPTTRGGWGATIVQLKAGHIPRD
jgi:dsDNA-specific endonuclease/ATPase MutS2